MAHRGWLPNSYILWIIILALWLLFTARRAVEFLYQKTKEDHNEI